MAASSEFRYLFKASSLVVFSLMSMLGCSDLYFKAPVLIAVQIVSLIVVHVCVTCVPSLLSH